MRPEILNWNNLSSERKNFFLKRSESNISDVMDSVSEIIDTVRERGDKALLDYTNRFDGIDLSKRELRVSGKDYTNEQLGEILLKYIIPLANSIKKETATMKTMIFMRE